MRTRRERQRHFQLLEQHRVVGGIVKPGRDEFISSTGIAHGDGKPRIFGGGPLIRKQEIDAVEPDLL